MDASSFAPPQPAARTVANGRVYKAIAAILASEGTERIGNIPKVRFAILAQVRLAVRPEAGSGWLLQQRCLQFPAETSAISTIAASAAAGQLWGGDANRIFHDDPQAREANRPRVDVFQRI